MKKVDVHCLCFLFVSPVLFFLEFLPSVLLLRRQARSTRNSLFFFKMQPKILTKKARKEAQAEIESVSEGPEKVKWNDTNTEAFLKVCLEEIEAGNRPHTHFTKEGWANIVEKFHKQTGKNYDKKQLKNRWDGLKQEFGMWAKLVEKETGLGCDPIKQTIIASSEWWAAKGKENPKSNDLEGTRSKIP